MKCSRCQREVSYHIRWVPVDNSNDYELKIFCESCWQELHKDDKLNPNWTTPKDDE